MILIILVVAPLTAIIFAGAAIAAGIFLAIVSAAVAVLSALFTRP